MKEILLQLIKGFITTGFRTLIYLFRKKNGDQKTELLINTIATIITTLKPIADESKTNVDNTILEILEEAISN